MSASAKDFQIVATSIGAKMIDLNVRSIDENTDIAAIIDAVSDGFRSCNPRFDSTEFVNHVMDVATGRRSRVTGKRTSP